MGFSVDMQISLNIKYDEQEFIISFYADMSIYFAGLISVTGLKKCMVILLVMRIFHIAKRINRLRYMWAANCFS